MEKHEKQISQNEKEKLSLTCVIGEKMPWKGKQPRCKTCGHVHFKHRRWFDEGDVTRHKCNVKGCDCKKYIPERENDHRWR